MTHVIYPAAPDDAEDLARVHVASWQESYRGLLPDSFLDRMSVHIHAERFRRSLTTPGAHDVTLLASDRNGTFGYISGSPSRNLIPGQAEVHTLYVRRAAQRRGVGQDLLISAARVFIAVGARSLMISTLRDNLPARSFYEHLGGQAEAPRREPGPGGVVYEVSYVWPDIMTVMQGSSRP